MAASLNLVSAPLRLNLGCSDHHPKGFVNVDICPPADVIADLSQRWPWEDSTVTEIQAWDIFEHLPSKQHTMNEAFRVLVPGGLLRMVVPTTDGRGAFQDPTHVSFWTPNDLWYWCEDYPEWKRFHKVASYGIRARYAVVSAKHEEFPGKVWKLDATLRAVK